MSLFLLLLLRSLACSLFLWNTDLASVSLKNQLTRNQKSALFICLWSRARNWNLSLVLASFWPMTHVISTSIYWNSPCWSMMSTNTSTNNFPSFTLARYVFSTKGHIAFAIYTPLMMARDQAESSKEPINHRKFINWFLLDIIKLIWQLKKINTKICRQSISISFNQICVCVYIYIYI